MIISSVIFISSCAEQQRPWRNEIGYDTEGYDLQGFKDGFDRQGYDLKGCNREGFDRIGNDCKEILIIKEQGFKWSQYESAKADLLKLKQKKDKLQKTFDRQKKTDQAHIQNLAQDVAQKNLDLIAKGVLINQAAKDLADQVLETKRADTEALAWQQRYTTEAHNLAQTTIMLQKRDAELAQANLDIAHKNSELATAKRDLSARDADVGGLNQKNTRLSNKLANQKTTARDWEQRFRNEESKHNYVAAELREKLSETQKILEAVRNFIDAKSAEQDRQVAEVFKEDDFSMLVSRLGELFDIPKQIQDWRLMPIIQNDIKVPQKTTRLILCSSENQLFSHKLDSNINYIYHVVGESIPSEIVCFETSEEENNFYSMIGDSNIMLDVSFLEPEMANKVHDLINSRPLKLGHISVWPKANDNNCDNPASPDPVFSTEIYDNLPPGSPEPVFSTRMYDNSPPVSPEPVFSTEIYDNLPPGSPEPVFSTRMYDNSPPASPEPVFSTRMYDNSPPASPEPVFSTEMYDNLTPSCPKGATEHGTPTRDSVRTKLGVKFGQ